MTGRRAQAPHETRPKGRRNEWRPVLAFAVPAAGAVAMAAVGLPRLGGEARRPVATPFREHIAVASENGLATRLGLAALRSGANAVDAAITIALSLGVVQPESSGIGGGGFALVWDAAQRKVTVLDFREMAPANVDAAAIDDRPKEPKAERRGRMIGVPGEVAGLVELHRRFGQRSLAEDAAPAIALAENGYYASRHLAQLAVAFHKELNWSPELRALYKPADWAVG